MNTNMNTGYQPVSKNDASIYRWNNRARIPQSKAKTSEAVQPGNTAVSKDEVVLSKSVRNEEIQNKTEGGQAADPQAEDKAQLQMRSGKMSSSDKTFIQLAGQYRDLTKDPATWPSMKELELLTNRAVRQETENTLGNLLRENGIQIPEGQSVRLTVDACDFHISVEGIEDKELAESIEKVLNQGQNGFDLFSHIQKCAPSRFGFEDSAQYNAEASSKSGLYHLVKEMTGYDIRELENQDGKFYTPEGNDLWMELKEKAEAYYPFQLEKYYEGYEKLAKNGWESVPDHTLSLDYVDGHLLDIDTKYGYGTGQTEWQEEFLPKGIGAEEDKASDMKQTEAGEQSEVVQKNKQASDSQAAGAAAENGQVSEKIADPNLAFPKFNPALKYAKYLKVLDEYYEKQNAENQRFANPEAHIRDKYFNKRSPYYIKGLSQREREIGADQEIGMLYGRQPSLNSYDPVIQSVFGGCNSFQADQEYRQELGGQISGCINQAFSQNGIHIPDGTTLYLTVDPYDYRIHAGGVEQDLADEIETILNQGQNGYSLYNYISYCNPGNMGQPEPEQYRQGDKAKAAVYHMVKQLTDYDLRTLENKNGKFYTPEGRDLWEVLSERYKEMTEQGEAGSFQLGAYYDHYRRVAKEGWNRGIDANLTIGYKNGTLYDVEQYRKI